MQVRKFEAPTLQEALKVIRAELGPEAIILNTKHYKKAFGLLSRGSVEVTAAITDEAVEKRKEMSRRLPEEVVRKIRDGKAQEEKQAMERLISYRRSKEERAIELEDRDERNDDSLELSDSTKLFRAPTMHVPVPERSSDTHKLENQILKLKSEIEKMKSNMQSSEPDNAVVRKFFNQLLASGIPRSLVMEWVSDITSDRRVIDEDTVLEGLVKVLSKRLTFENILEHKSVLFVGPSGSGKTTSMLKVALKSAKDSESKVLVVDLNERDEKSRFCQAICSAKGLDYHNGDSASLQAMDFSRYSHIYVDSTGGRVGDWNMDRFQKAIGVIPDLHITTVIPAQYRVDEAKFWIKEYRKIRSTSVSLTRLDEVVMAGNIVLMTENFPLALFSVGQTIPDDIELASLERIVGLLFSIS